MKPDQITEDAISRLTAGGALVVAILAVTSAALTALFG